MKWSEHVGQTYRSFGAEYEVMEWDARKGFRMRLMAGTDKLLGRRVGDETWVSERALDRTYLRVYDW